MFENYFRSSNNEICLGNADDKTRKDSAFIGNYLHDSAKNKDGVTADK